MANIPTFALRCARAARSPALSGSAFEIGTDRRRAEARGQRFALAAPPSFAYCRLPDDAPDPVAPDPVAPDPVAPDPVAPEPVAPELELFRDFMPPPEDVPVVPCPAVLAR